MIVLNQKGFSFAFFKYLAYNVVKTSPVHMDPQKQLKTLHYASVVGDVTLLRSTERLSDIS